jgi:hypothetical protein
MFCGKCLSRASVGLDLDEVFGVDGVNGDQGRHKGSAQALSSLIAGNPAQAELTRLLRALASSAGFAPVIDLVHKTGNAAFGSASFGGLWPRTKLERGAQ